MIEVAPSDTSSPHDYPHVLLADQSFAVLAATALTLSEVRQSGLRDWYYMGLSSLKRNIIFKSGIKYAYYHQNGYYVQTEIKG